MSLFSAELKYFLRSPVIWFIMALATFVSAWAFLLSIDLFTIMQVKFAGMSDAPTVLQGIVFPVIAAQAKLMIFIASILSGLSFARLSHANGWFLIQMDQHSQLYVVKQKYMAVVLIGFLFLLPTLLAVITLMFLADLNAFIILTAFIGLLLLTLWMMALGLFVSSLVANSGFSILLCLLVFFMFWMLGQSGIEDSWGKNWLVVFSPQYHFKQFLSASVSYASVLYFCMGTVVLLWASQIRLIQKRFVL